MLQSIVQPLRHLRLPSIRGARTRRLVEDAVAAPGGALRRHLVTGALLALAVVAAVAATIAWQQYDAGRRRALTDAHSRAVSIAGLVDASFRGLTTALATAAASDALRGRDLAATHAYLRRIAPAYEGNLGLLGLDGRMRTSIPSAGAGTFAGQPFADRTFFTQVVATGKPFVSEGVVSRLTGSTVFVVSVPVRDPRGRLTGVLVDSVPLSGLASARAVTQLGYEGLTIVDREDRLLAPGLPAVTNRALLDRLRRAGGDGVVGETDGLLGGQGHAVAYATSPVTGWLVAIDRQRSALFASALRALVLDLAGLGGGLAVVLALLTWGVRRSCADEARRSASVRRWGELTTRLGAAVTTVEVAQGLADGLAALLPGAAVAVALDEDDGQGLHCAALRGDAAAAEPLLRAAQALRPVADEPLVLERESQRVAAVGAATAHALGRRTLVARRIGAPSGRGGVAVIALPRERRLSVVDRSSVQAYVDQAAQAFDRALLQQREHADALTLQHGLLPEVLPDADGVVLAGHYRAGGDGVEIGGDWYDAVRRADGTVCISVGDVVGHGIPAAVLMGRLHNAFRAYAFDGATPVEIMRRLSRHLNESDMATAVCVVIDPYGRTVAYSSAGHPPALIASADGITRLDRASAPPLGVAAVDTFREGRAELRHDALLLLYTDGLTELRGTDLSARIALLERTLDEASRAAGAAAGTPPAAEQALASILHRLVGDRAPADDVALVLAALSHAPATLDVEVPAEPEQLAPLRRRLRAWLAAHEVPELRVGRIVVAVAEALNNAIEHGTPQRRGTVWLRASIDRPSERLVLRVSDSGSWIEGRATPGRGRGLVLMRGLMDEVTIDRGPTGTVVTLATGLGEPALVAPPVAGAASDEAR